MPRKIFERQLAEVEDDITSICERVVYIVPRHDGRTQRSEALKQLDITVVGAGPPGGEAKQPYPDSLSLKSLNSFCTFGSMMALQYGDSRFRS